MNTVYYPKGYIGYTLSDTDLLNISKQKRTYLQSMRLLHLVNNQWILGVSFYLGNSFDEDNFNKLKEDKDYLTKLKNRLGYELPIFWAVDQLPAPIINFTTEITPKTNSKHTCLHCFYGDKVSGLCRLTSKSFKMGEQNCPDFTTSVSLNLVKNP